jgi:hypothetical protein
MHSIKLFTGSDEIQYDTLYPKITGKVKIKIKVVLVKQKKKKLKLSL